MRPAEAIAVDLLEVRANLLVVGVLPGLARIDQGHTDAGAGGLLKDCQAVGLRPAARPI